MTVLSSIYGDLVAQNFPWVTGATGRSWGDGTTVDTDGNIIVVGCHNPDGNVEFSAVAAPPIPAQNSIGPEFTNAYIVRYDQFGNPLDNAWIRPVNNANCGLNFGNQDFWAALKKVVVTPNNEIYAIGEFFGCGLEFENGLNPVTSAVSGNFQPDRHRVFVVHYDATLDYQGCHIFTPNGPCSSIYGTPAGPSLSPPQAIGERNSSAADIALGVQDVNDAVFIAANFCGDAIGVERFDNSGSTPLITTNRPINQGLNNQFQVYVAEINYTTNTLVNDVEIGLEHDDFCTELASGYYYGSTDLYLAGTFGNSIAFTQASTSSTINYVSNGSSDAFACRFDNMDLNEQSPVVAGGTGPDQALSLSDDGLMVGGFITNNAVFNGFGTLTLNPITTPFANPRSEGFIAIPDYDNNDWEWATNITGGAPITNCWSSMVNELAGSCEEVYVVWTRGMRNGMDGFMDAHEHHYQSNVLPEIGNPATANERMAYSRLEKWHHQGNTAAQIWTHDLLPFGLNLQCPNGGNYNVSTLNRKVLLVEDIHVRSEQYFDPPEDVVITGWFGTEIAIPNNPPWVTNPVYDGGGPGVHDQNGMFLLTMDEIPELSFNQLEACLFNDPFMIDWDFLPVSFNWNQAGITVNITGPGITDPITGAFDPSLAGVGIHTINLELDYYGCLYEYTIAEIEVYADELYPRQPEVDAIDWSEGLAAEGITDQELATLLAQSSELFGEEFSFLAGRFMNEISFERFNDPSSPIVLTAQGGGEAGYIVAYGPCGAYWALRIDAAGADYIEALKVHGEVVSPDETIPWLYAAGGIDGTGVAGVIEVEHSEDPLLVPTAAVNGTYPINGGAVTCNEKGIIMRINPLTGEVDWVYLGGDVSADENRFHGLTAIDNFVSAVGEWATSYHDPVNTVTTANFGGYDPFFVVLEDNGTFVQYSIDNAPPFGSGFGTPNDDRGDAIDVTETPDGDPFFYMAGVFDFSGGVSLSQSFQTFVSGNTNPGALSATDVFVSTHPFDPVNNLYTDERLKVYNNTPIGAPGPDMVHDIRLPAGGGAVPDVGFGDNEVFICGSFENDFTHDFVTMTSIGATDMFIGSLDLLLTDNWFSHEGYDNIFTNESANSLDIINTDVVVYGSRTGGPGLGTFLTSEKHNSGGINAGTLDAFPPVVGLNQSEIFAAIFTPNGIGFQLNSAIPSSTGPHTGNDVTVINGDMRVAGITSPSIPTGIVDFFNQSTVLHHTLDRTGLKDAYLGRLEWNVGLGYYKRNETISYQTEDTLIVGLFPNPSSSGFTINFNEPSSGSLRVYDGAGKLIIAERVERSNEYYFGDDLSNGFYSLQYITTKEVVNFRIIVQ